MVESCELRGQSKNSGEFLTLTPEVPDPVSDVSDVSALTPEVSSGSWGQSKITPISAIGRDNEDFTLTPTISTEFLTLTPTIS